MKKLFLITILMLTTSAWADIKYDATLNKVYSVPRSPQINLNEYNGLFLQITVMNLQCWNNGIYGKKIREQITRYLKTLKTPTALRLLSDLQKDWR